MTSTKAIKSLSVAIFALSALFMAGAQNASAASEATEAKRMELKAEIQARKQNLEAKKQAAQAEAAAKKARAQLEALVDRLDDIREKILSRIEKMEEDGLDASPARDAYSTASFTLNLAREAVKTATSTKKAFETAESLVKKAQDDLAEVVEAMKSL